MMKKNLIILLAALFAWPFMSTGQVIISQIYEGVSFDKYIEITNIGTAPADLENPQLTVKLYSNVTEIGGNTPTFTKDLTGSLLPGQSLLIWNAQAAAPAYALSYTPGFADQVTSFNGTGTNAAPLASTDIIGLYNGTTLLDVFAWGTFQYKDKSYYRNLSVVSPNPVWTEAEWTEATLADVNNALSGTIERLGYHGAVSTAPLLIILSPGDSSNVYSANVNIIFSVYNHMIPDSGHILYNVDGGTDVPHYTTTPIALTGLTDGTYTVELTLVDTAGNPLTPDVSAVVTFTVNLSGPAITTIYEIQYTTLPNGDSPLLDSIVTTTGIVTAAFSSGYFIQDGTDPWNGLYIFDNTHSPARGDSILVTGTVYEYYNYTELKTITDYNIIETGKPLPDAVEVTTTSVKQEQWEGMLVQLVNARCVYVSPTGWWKVVQGTDTCEIGKLIFPFSAAVVGSFLFRHTSRRHDGEACHASSV
jgi:predicted extracellular nuclease